MSNAKVYKWSLIERITVAVLNFGGNIALARMLTTADFGLLAMIAIFIAIASDLSSCGLTDGLIHKAHPTKEDYSTIFVFNTAFGLLFGLSFFFGAPLVAGFFGHEELKGIMRVLGICFFFQTMSFVQETKLRKELEMKKICFVKVGATITSLALGLTLAAVGFGYWALVCTQILLSVFIFLYYLAASRWFPKIAFCSKSFKELFSFGIHLVLAYIGTVIGKNINTFVLGKFYAPSTSGVYSQGAKLANVPFSVTENSINSPFFVVASNETDPETQRNLIRNMLSVIVGVNGLLLCFMLVIAAPGIAALYGEKWMGAVPVFRILALFEFLCCVKAYFQTVCKVHGRTVFIRNLSFAEVAFQLLLLSIFYPDGLIWVAWTQIGGGFQNVVVHSFLYCHLTRQRHRDLAATMARALCLPFVGGFFATGVSIAVYALVDVPAIIMCLIIAAAYAVSIVGMGEITKPYVYMTLRQRFLKR